MRCFLDRARPAHFAIILAAAFALAGCERDHIPPYSEAQELKLRAEQAKDMKDPTGDLAYLRTVTFGDEPATIGRDPKNTVALEHWGADPVRLQKFGSDLLILNSPKDVTFGGKPVKAGMKLSQRDFSPSRWLHSGAISMNAYTRDQKLRGQIFDGNSLPIQQFHGMNWYPPHSQYRVRAEWIPLPPGQKLVMPRTHGGADLKEDAAGYVAFSIDGKPLKLYASLEAAPGMTSRLFLVFRDLTSKTETYQPGRFLFIDFDSDSFDPAHKFDPTKKTRMALDFNQAQNPPCAYNPNTNCPIAPPENRLSVPIPAGEKRHLPSA